MLTTRAHRLAPAEVIVDADGSVVVKARDLVLREHVTGRMKGCIEHTVLEFHFAGKAELIRWLDECRAEAEVNE